jgi:hypothetical protein
MQIECNNCFPILFLLILLKQTYELSNAGLYLLADFWFIVDLSQPNKGRRIVSANR